MNTFYTDEQNTLMLIALLKEHGIKKVVASPGATNINFVVSIQQDPFFEIYSCVDERSAAYMACGLAEESGEPVVISCTGATASRNYYPGLTEAFYRKVPVLAVTSSRHLSQLGQNIDQVTDRSCPPKDLVKYNVTIPTVYSKDDAWGCEVQINKALLELRRNGGGPVHINLITNYSSNYSVKELPKVRAIKRITYIDKLPEISDNKRVVIFVGAHSNWNSELEKAVDEFCAKFDAVVFCDQTSNYKGAFRIMPKLILSQQYNFEYNDFDIAIHLGNISGIQIALKTKEVWRVNPDGEVRDTFKKLRYVFQMEEVEYFKRANLQDTSNRLNKNSIKHWKNEYDKIYNQIPEIPFSNLLIAKETSKLLPENSVLHMGILNSLRSWNYFNLDNTISGYCTTGGFGIDGCVSSLIGSSLNNYDKLHFGIVGDLAFFYDMNSIGNRHIGNNLRLIIINNGKGTEFKNYNSHAARFGEDTDTYVGAAGHFGNQSNELIKNYSQSLGFNYLSASSKTEFLNVINKFVHPKLGKKSIILEVFTNSVDESDALEKINSIIVPKDNATKKIVKNILGEKGIANLKKILNKDV